MRASKIDLDEHDKFMIYVYVYTFIYTHYNPVEPIGTDARTEMRNIDIVVIHLPNQSCTSV